MAPPPMSPIEAALRAIATELDRAVADFGP